MVKYDTAEPLNEMLGIAMPELPDEFGAKLGYYSILAETVAESEYEFPDGSLLVFRLCPEADLDISGVYGYEYHDDWTIAGTETEVDVYQSMLIALGNVTAADGTVYSFAVDSEGLEFKVKEGTISFSNFTVSESLGNNKEYT